MTVKEMEARIDELAVEIDELEDAVDCEKFCDDCEFIRIATDIEEYWGAKCIRETPVCDADFAPEFRECPRREEYTELTDRLEVLRAEYEKLCDAYEAV